MLNTSKRKIKILLFGYIDLNVLDGSSIFLTGIAQMLSISKDIEIDLILAKPIKRDIVLNLILDLSNVNIISPFEDSRLRTQIKDWHSTDRMTHLEASHVLNYYWTQKKYDWLFIRGIEVVEHLLTLNPVILPRALVYLTGITHENQVLSTMHKQKYRNIFNTCARIICQTHEMRNYVTLHFSEKYIEEKIITLYPTIPNVNTDFSSIFSKKRIYNKLCYAGKFDLYWNSIPIIISFKELREQIPELELNIAGDHFKKNKEQSDYVVEMKYHLTNTENLHWKGALSRKLANELILQSDIGIAWRHKHLDTSLELSTKVLEYGNLGKPVILNPTKMHRRIFGDDYPLFADTREEFLTVVKTVVNNPDLYETVSRKMFHTCKKYTFSETLKKLLPYLIDKHPS